MTSKFMKLSLAVALVVVLMTLSAPEVEGVTCGEVVSAVAPCLGYLRNGGAPPSVCCSGVRGLRNKARTTGDRKTICNCLKSASSSYKGVSGNYAASLPGKCGINFPYKISPSTDCNRVGHGSFERGKPDPESNEVAMMDEPKVELRGI